MKYRPSRAWPGRIDPQAAVPPDTQGSIDVYPITRGRHVRFCRFHPVDSRVAADTVSDDRIAICCGLQIGRRSLRTATRREPAPAATVAETCG